MSLGNLTSAVIGNAINTSSGPGNTAQNPKNKPPLSAIEIARGLTVSEDTPDPTTGIGEKNDESSTIPPRFWGTDSVIRQYEQNLIDKSLAGLGVENGRSNAGVDGTNNIGVGTPVGGRGNTNTFYPLSNDAYGDGRGVAKEAQKNNLQGALDLAQFTGMAGPMGGGSPTMPGISWPGDSGGAKEQEKGGESSRNDTTVRPPRPQRVPNPQSEKKADPRDNGIPELNEQRDADRKLLKEKYPAAEKINEMNRRFEDIKTETDEDKKTNLQTAYDTFKKDMSEAKDNDGLKVKALETFREALEASDHEKPEEIIQKLLNPPPAPTA